MVLRVVGRLFIAAGVLILAFLGYQIWGTDLITDREQEQLQGDLDEFLSVREPDPEFKPDLGDGIMRIEIPKIDLNWVVVEGVTVEALKKGPGHYPGTKLPGDGGNVVISGHRTTYGAPFSRVDEVIGGDYVRLTSREGIFEYRVVETKVVAPTDLSVVVERGEEVLTLTTCHPRFSARQRLIVVAHPVEEVEAA